MCGGFMHTLFIVAVASASGLVTGPALCTLRASLSLTQPDNFHVTTYLPSPIKFASTGSSSMAAGKTWGRFHRIAHSPEGQAQAKLCAASRTLAIISSSSMRDRARNRRQVITDKFYHQHTGYVGNLKSIALGKLLKEHRSGAIEFAVKACCRRALGRLCTRLHVFRRCRASASSTAAKPLNFLRFPGK